MLEFRKITEIANKYGLASCLDNYPIGFVTWDPRNMPEYVEINTTESAYTGD